MATCDQDRTLQRLELPSEFEDLEGLLKTDLRAIVGVLAGRAGERLLLTRRESHQLRQNLWNRLITAVNETLDPLSADRR